MDVGINSVVQALLNADLDQFSDSLFALGDNNCVLKAYKTAFPGYNRDGDILKKYWNNWKKDSPAYKDFIKSLKK